MAKARKLKLKVFRTPIGFHDAYVAAPSQKAALEAWSTDVNLFARGVAEEVTEPELMQEPLANPGVVFKRLRGTEKEQIAALGEGEVRPLGGKRPSPQPSPASERGGGKEGGSRIKSGMTKKKRPPKPSRAGRPEEAMEALEKGQRRELAALEKREEELTRERRELERRHERERRKAAKTVEEARQAYESAVQEWERA